MQEERERKVGKASAPNHVHVSLLYSYSSLFLSNCSCSYFC